MIQIKSIYGKVLFTHKDLEHAFHAGMAKYACFSDWYREYRMIINRETAFNEEDMCDFAEWFSANWDLDFKADRAMEIWLKERKKS